MLGHGAKFGHKKEQAIAALLSHRNVEEAARAIGINANTLLRWTKDPDFDAAYREARRTAFEQSIARLQDAAGAAVTTVLKIMLDTKVPAGTRLRAAEVVLERGAQAIEMEDLEARVVELERAANSAKRSRRRPAILTLLSTKALPGPTTSAQISAPRPGSSETDGDGGE
jgi:transposase-like protein